MKKKGAMELIGQCIDDYLLDFESNSGNTDFTILKEKFDPIVVAWFRTATREQAAIKSKAIRNISISDVWIRNEFLVADIMDELTWVVEPNKEYRKDNIILGNAVVSLVNNLIPIWVLTPTRVTTKAHRGDIIAQYQKAEYVIDH
uniref:Uncharacterized protein n=1 Tax=Glossina austeni TaxID=7395 RepID=A0A1A9UVM2_GLOAU